MNKTLTETSEILRSEIFNALEDVKDPEIPTLSVVDLGIIVDVKVETDNNVTIIMTPTFSGCPALKILQEQIRVRASKVEGVKSAMVEVSYETTWTSNMITEKGKKILEEFGIAPPVCYTDELDVATVKKAKCPYCGSENTTFKSPFGATLCRSIHYCNDCDQAFDQFKPVG